MIWSAVKIVLFILLIVALTLGADMLTGADAGIRLVFGGYEFNLNAVQAVLALAVLVLVIWLLLKVVGFFFALVRFANGDETAVSRYFDRRGQQRGFEALSEGLTALAAGDGRTALAKADAAERHLRRPDLTNLISAQAAEMVGDTKKAEAAYKRLVRDERTRFVGVRGLMKQKLADGDTETAMKLAEKAFALKPSHVETGETLLRLQAEEEDWAGARKTISEKNRAGVLPRDVHRRRDAVLALQEARDVFRHGSTVEARETAIEANRLSPDLVPAAVMAAQAYISDNKPKYAERVLKKAWASQPHPDLAATYASVMPDETAEERIKRFRPILRQQPDHAETKMLDAELQLAAGDHDAARKALGTLIDDNPTARVLSIMAAIERAEGSGDDVVRAWLAKAIAAPRGPQWVCDNCNRVHSTWGPVCDNCGGFDTIAWTTPAENARAMPSGSELLPLIAATSDTPAEPVQDLPATVETVVDEVEIVDELEKPEAATS